jgi:hypothetical protein
MAALKDVAKATQVSFKKVFRILQEYYRYSCKRLDLRLHL